jgi:CO/xanthine dehydrogenase Mo-binding subunit
LQTQFATETHLDIAAERLGLDPFEIRRVNAMQDGALTHTKQRLGSVSLLRTLEAAEKASGWEAGVPDSRGATRGDLGRDDVRPAVSLGARFAAVEKQEAAE